MRTCTHAGQVVLGAESVGLEEVQSQDMGIRRDVP